MTNIKVSMGIRKEVNDPSLLCQRTNEGPRIFVRVYKYAYPHQDDKSSLLCPASRAMVPVVKTFGART